MAYAALGLVAWPRPTAASPCPVPRGGRQRRTNRSAPASADRRDDHAVPLDQRRARRARRTPCRRRTPSTVSTDQSSLPGGQVHRPAALPLGPEREHPPAGHGRRRPRAGVEPEPVDVVRRVPARPDRLAGAGVQAVEHGLVLHAVVQQHLPVDDDRAGPPLADLGLPQSPSARPSASRRRRRRRRRRRGSGRGTAASPGPPARGVGGGGAGGRRDDGRGDGEEDQQAAVEQWHGP